jgi:hypothetical protein
MSNHGTSEYLHDFSVEAIRGGKKSLPSSTFTVTTTTPPLSDAVLNWNGTVRYKMVAVPPASTGITWTGVKSTWEDPWEFVPSCTSGPCDTTLDGSINGEPFTAKLSPKGSTYSGAAAINNYWYCGGNASNYVKTTLHIQVTGKHAALKDEKWTIISFTGTAIWDISDVSVKGCPGELDGTFKMQVQST